MTSDQILRDFTPAQIEDLRTLAAQDGREMGDVAAQFNGVDDFETLAAEVEASMPAGFVSAEWGYGEGTLTVRPGSKAKATALAKGHADIARVIESDRPSKADQDAIVKEVADSLRGTGGLVSVGYDVASNRVVASVTADASRRVAVAAPASEKASVHGVKVDVVTTEARTEEAAARGGMVYSSCTGAFIVRTTSGTRGILTANHCETKPSTYDGNTTGTTYSDPNPASRDLRWTAFTSGTSSSSFQYMAGGFRNATAATNPTVGAPVCKYGKVTGRFCTTIAQSGLCGSYCGLYKTAAGSVQPGDSGGPWYYGNTAHGVTHGFNYNTSPTQPTADLFTGAVDLLMGVVIVTG